MKRTLLGLTGFVFSVFIFFPLTILTSEALFPSEELGIPFHKELKDLCSGNVLSQNGDEIVWHVFSSPEPLSEIIKDYQHKLGKEGSEEKDLKGWIWRFEKEGPSSISNPSEIGRVLFI